jgi:hypothetical protein
VELAGGFIGQEFWVKSGAAYWATGIGKKSETAHRIHPSDNSFRNLKSSEAI